MAIRFLYDNLLDSAVLTESSAATGFPVSNLKNPFRSKIWRTAGTTPGTADLVFDLSSLWSTTGSNLVSNGADFTGGPPPTGWTAVNCTLAAVGGGQAGNCLEITRTAGATQTAKQTITCIPGNLYRLHFYVHDGTNPTENFDVDVTGAGGSLVNCSAASSATWDNYPYYYFIADQAAITVWLNRNVNGAGTMLFDTIEVYEMAGDSINCIALTGYNWASAPGTLDLEFNYYNTWGGPPATESLTWHITPTVNGNKATIIKTFAEKKYLYARLNVVYAPGDWDLGRLFIGTYFEPTYGYSPNWTGEYIDESIGQRTIGGQDHFDEIEQYREFGLSFKIDSQAQWKLFQTMINTVGVRKDLFIALDYTNEPDEMTIYGKFTSLPGMSSFAPYGQNANFNLRESR